MSNPGRASGFLVVLLLAVSLGCGRPGGGSQTDEPSNKPVPASIAQIEGLRQSGVAWSNKEIRVYYLKLVSAIGPADELWKKEGLSAEERAKRAFQMRHDARALCRAMMSDPADIEALQKRDLEKYGHADGPTFDSLVAHNQQKGLTGDAVFEAIVESAQRTNGAVNDMLGVR